MNKKHLFVTAVMSAVIGVSSLAAAFSSGISALADEPHTGVQGQHFYAQKYLIMDDDANVPNVKFTYTLSNGNRVPYDSKKGTLEINPGPTDGAKIGDAIFTSESKTYTSAQEMVHKEKTKDTVNLKEGQKYARSDIDVDLSAVRFTEPGVYRYKITENQTPVQGVTYDQDTVRYLDVYIHTNEVGELSVAGSVLHKDASDLPADGTYPEEKDNGFENVYKTHDLTLKKNVSGNQASHSHYFAFTVNLSSKLPGTVYSVKLNGTPAQVKQNGTEYTNPVKLTAGNDGKCTAKFMLRHGQSVCIQGITDDTEYTVSENSEDYDASVAVGEAKSVKKDTTDAQTIKNDMTVSFVNTREGKVPTGIFESSMIWIVLLGIGAIGFAAVNVHKKKD